MKIKNFPKHKQRRKLLFPFAAVVFACGAACHSANDNNATGEIFVVKSPTDGTISQILVSEGAAIRKDAGIVEIETRGTSEKPLPENDSRPPLTATVQQSQKDVEAARREVERASVEVQRVEPLVASNSVPPAQLDAARADFQKAQERLQNALDQEKARETDLLVEQSRGASSTSQAAPPSTRTVVARVPIAGTLKVLNARVGQKVKTGQPLATVLQN